MTVEQQSNGAARPMEVSAGEHAATGDRVRPSLVTLLTRAGVASEQDLRLAVAEGMATGERLGEVVLRRGWIDEQRLAELLAEQWQLPFVPDPHLTAQATRTLSFDAARELGVCPIDFDADRPHLALVEPSEERFAAAAAAVDYEPQFAVVTRSALLSLLDQQSSTQSRAEDDGSEAADDSSLGFEREADAVVAGIEAAALAVSGLRAKLAARADDAERALAASHRELAELREARATDQATIERLQRELHAQRELRAQARAHLVELAQTLDEA